MGKVILSLLTQVV